MCKLFLWSSLHMSKTPVSDIFLIIEKRINESQRSQTSPTDCPIRHSKGFSIQSFSFSESDLFLSKGRNTMDVRVGLLVLFLLGANWHCDARQLEKPYLSEMRIGYEKQDGEIQTSKDVTRNDNICTLCEEYATQALDYLGRNKTQEEILELLHQSCSQLHSFKQQCTTLVDYYAPLFFLEISSIQPTEFCRKVNLCQQIVLISTQLREDSCDLCHHVVSEVLTKLKDPSTQLEIIQVLLKACKNTKDYEAKCKKLVFEYGPLFLVNAEEFLESRDICTALHACDLPMSSSLKVDEKLHSDS